MTRPGSRRAAVLIALSLAATGCGVNGLNFQQDERVTITAPADRAKVELPLTIRWRVRDFRITGPDGARRTDAGYFGVYVDRAPQPPQLTQEWLVREDSQCKIDPACPNEAFLAENDIYGTSRTTLMLDDIRDLDPDSDRRDFHEITIALLNGRGERIGESAFTVEFEVDRSL